MLPTDYVVWFSNGEYPLFSIRVSAFNVNEASILAKAERIKQGLDYTIQKIEEIKR